MGIGEWWTEALGNFSESPYRDISEFKGKRYAVDLSIWLNKYLCSDIDRLATTSNPPYPAPDLLRNIQKVHNSLSKWVTLVYVFDGFAPPQKNRTKATRLNKIRDGGAAWLDLHQRVKDGDKLVVSEGEMKLATSARMSMEKPTAVDHASIMKWLEDKGIEHYGSLYEADQQLIKLEKDGIVDGIISEDGDEVANGARHLLCKMSRKSNGEYQFKCWDRDHFFGRENPYQSKLCLYPHLIVDAALLLGNDYCKRIENNGAGTVLKGTLPRAPSKATEEEKANFKANRKRRNDSMLDKMAKANDLKEWLDKYGKNGISAMPSDIVDAYWNARRYVLHAPVLEYDEETGEVMVVPLNPLPDATTDLGKYIGIEELESLENNKQLLHTIYHCKVLPLDRKPLEHYKQMLEKPIFAELDFDADPVIVQPKLCIVNWLRARGLDCRLSDSREILEDHVASCLRVGKQIQSPPLQPIAGSHDGFIRIKTRQGNNPYDNWNHEYFSIANKMEIITDDMIDELLGEKRHCRPSIRHRVDKLFSGGFYDPKSIKCRNVESKEDGTECILICCQCLSSKTSVIHTIYAVFEDKPGGQYLLELSSCSCKKGEHFCSHSIGFLHVMAVLQQAATSQEQFEKSYRINPQLIQNVLMLIENVVVADKFQQQNAQQKRQRTS